MRKGYWDWLQAETDDGLERLYDSCVSKKVKSGPYKGCVQTKSANMANAIHFEQIRRREESDGETVIVGEMG